jgi:GNAT superfamily N-acetyltransferase
VHLADCYAGEPVGYLVVTLGYSLEYGGRDAFVDEVYIRSTHREKGIGTAALTFAEEQCRVLGVRAYTSKSSARIPTRMESTVTSASLIRIAL